MNADRRKDIDAIITALQEVKGRIEDVASEEQDSFDAMPEGLQNSDKGQHTEETAQELEAIADDLDDLLERLGGCKE